jgi:hypothetical protein
MQLKIATILKRAIVYFPENSQMSGNFFVSVMSEYRDGGELISELFAKDKKYIPFESDQGEIVLLRIENIMMVHIEEDVADNYLPGFKQVQVSVNLMTGQIIHRKISFALPETHSRLSDFLNSRDAFFRLDVDGKNYLVQNRFVKSIAAGKTD